MRPELTKPSNERAATNESRSFERLSRRGGFRLARNFDLLSRDDRGAVEVVGREDRVDRVLDASAGGGAAFGEGPEGGAAPHRDGAEPLGSGRIEARRREGRDRDDRTQERQSDGRHQARSLPSQCVHSKLSQGPYLGPNACSSTIFYQG